MTFSEYCRTLTKEQRIEIRKVISDGYLTHLRTGRRKVGPKTYNKLKKIDSNLTWETLRGE